MPIKLVTFPFGTVKLKDNCFKPLSGKLVEVGFPLVFGEVESGSLIPPVEVELPDVNEVCASHGRGMPIPFLVLG